MAHAHVIIDANSYFMIDPYTRRISCGATNRKEIMQGDHKSERITFLVPRTIEGHDLLLCDSICVHYDNISIGKKLISSGAYEIDDIAEYAKDPAYLKFSWLIHDDATKYAGTLEFSITFSCIEGSQKDFVWSASGASLITVLPCRQNIQNIANSYPAIIEQMIAQLDALKQQVSTLNDRISSIEG